MVSVEMIQKLKTNTLLTTVLCKFSRAMLMTDVEIHYLQVLDD